MEEEKVFLDDMLKGESKPTIKEVVSEDDKSPVSSTNKRVTEAEIAGLGGEYDDSDVLKDADALSPVTVDNKIVTENELVENIVTSDNSIAFADDSSFSFTATAADITVAGQKKGASGGIEIHSAENITGWGSEFGWGNAGVPTDLNGTETFGYMIFSASGINSIRIGRL